MRLLQQLRQMSELCFSQRSYGKVLPDPSRKLLNGYMREKEFPMKKGKRENIYGTVDLLLRKIILLHFLVHFLRHMLSLSDKERQKNQEWWNSVKKSTCFLNSLKNS